MKSKKNILLLSSFFILSVGTTLSFAQNQDNVSADIGSQIYLTQCATCHAAPDNTLADSVSVRAPSLDMLRGLPPTAVVTSLTNGKMVVQGQLLSEEERSAVAEFVTGRTIASVTSSQFVSSQCSSTPLLSESFDNPGWNGWGAGLSNTRFQSAEQAQLSVDQVPDLSLAWAFGFENALSARTQPSIVGDWLFTGGDNGEVFALDTATGCTHWSFKAQAAIRTAMSVAPYTLDDGSISYRLIFGDGQANAYALDAQTGTPLWVRKVDEHVNAGITGAPSIYQGSVFVPVSAAGEEVRGPNPDYGCCTFRGSVSALDIETGEVLWKTYSIADEPSPKGLSSNGVQLFGPAGAGIWGYPTIDPDRGVLYIGTGNGYSDPVQTNTDAIIAMDLQSGEIKWVKQTLPADNWLWQCEAEINANNPSCPANQGPDFDFATSPILTRVASSGKELLIVPQKSGMVYALDPDQSGEIVWQFRMGVGSPLGGQWGAATDGQAVYIGVADTLADQPGGMYAISLENGEQQWFTPALAPICDGGVEQNCFAAQGGAVSAIPGVTFSGGSDGGIRAYASEDGELIWQYNTNRSFETVNGVSASGATMDASGPVIVNGMLFINSGYNGIVGRAGNVLLAFKIN